MPKVTSPVAPPTASAVTTTARPAAPTVVADASLDPGWRGAGPAAPAREPSVVPAATDPAVASNVKVLNLSGTTLEPGRPLVLDGRPIGSQHEHVGSPEWKFFDGLDGAQSRRLEINAEACPIKIFEIRVHYEGEGGADGPGR